MSCEGVGPGGCVCGVAVYERSVDVEQDRIIASSEGCFEKTVHLPSVASEPCRTDGLTRRFRGKELLQFPRVVQSRARGGVVEDAPHMSGGRRAANRLSQRSDVVLLIA